MLDLRFVVEHLDEVRTALARRGEVPSGFERITELAQARRAAIVAGEAKKRAVNEASASIAKLAKGSPEQGAARDAARALGSEAAEYERAQKAAEAEIEELLLRVPNTPDPSVPDGDSADHNVVVRTWGEKPQLAFTPREHHDLGEALGILDFERASKLSGARFSVLWGVGAAMERALVQLMLDVHVHEHGYTEVYPPYLVKSDALRGTGNLPKFEADLFKIHAEGERSYDLYLIPTAEVPVTNLHGGEILDEPSLPRRYVAYTPCFRSEAGSYGRDTRGLIRQHQFDKVELVHLERPEDSEGGH